MKRFMVAMLGLAFLVVGCGKGVVDSTYTQDNKSEYGQNGSIPIMADYFPMDVGMTWTYGDRASVIQVTEPIRTIYGAAYAVTGLMQNRVLRKTVDGRVLELRDDTWRLLFDLNAAEKTSWKIEASGEQYDLLDGSTVTIESQSDTVTVPFGRFTNTVHLVIRPREGLFDAGISEMWFAPGVGLVKWSESWIGGMRVHELTTFGIKDPVDETDSKMDIRGQITSLTGPGDGNQDRGFLGRVMIEGKREPGMSDRAYVNITTSTRILEVVGTERRKVGFDALQTGQNVEARFIGPVLTSYPVQATAGEIVILKE